MLLLLLLLLLMMMMDGAVGVGSCSFRRNLRSGFREQTWKSHQSTQQRIVFLRFRIAVGRIARRESLVVTSKAARYFRDSNIRSKHTRLIPFQQLS